MLNLISSFASLWNRFLVWLSNTLHTRWWKLMFRIWCLKTQAERSRTVSLCLLGSKGTFWRESVNHNCLVSWFEALIEQKTWTYGWEKMWRSLSNTVYILYIQVCFDFTSDLMVYLQAAQCRTNERSSKTHKKYLNQNYAPCETQQHSNHTA